MTDEFAALSRPYVCKLGAPVVDRVEVRVFLESYFQDCMNCHFCHDACCQYGATVETVKQNALLARADELEAYVGVPRHRWFEDWTELDDDYPGGSYTRTQVVDGACAFLNRNGRGCLLHAFAMERGESVHDLKPFVCGTFPVLFDEGALVVPLEIDDRELVCVGQGPTLYRSARADLEHHFGRDLVAELDALETRVLAHQPLIRASSRTSLPVIPAWRRTAS